MQRALLCGSQIEGLRGVHHDLERMAAMLRERGFAVAVRAEADATRAGILAGYDQLIAESQPGDAAVFYYSGHGARLTTPGPEPRSWQHIAPTDLFDSTEADWRGISAWELSIKLTELTARTRNVTVILDCCHAAQMSRDAAVDDAIARALPHPVRQGVDAHLAALRARYRAFDATEPLGNRDAVKIIACDPFQTAWECRGQDGRYGGMLTGTLLEILRELGGASVSWATVAEALRTRVLRRYRNQRPDIEGPARRHVFSVIEQDERGHVALTTTNAGLQLPIGQLAGVTCGDLYAAYPLTERAFALEDALAVLEISEVGPLSSQAVVQEGRRAIPNDAIAVPIRKEAERRPILLEAPTSARAAITAMIARARTLRVAAAPEPSALATLRLTGDALTIEDARGPLFPPAHFPAQLEGVVKNLANLAAAQGLRELEGEHGVGACELDVELGVVDRDEPRPLPRHGCALGLGDRVYVRCRNTGTRRLYVHVFSLGVRGKISLLTIATPSGFALDPGAPPFVLGQLPRGPLVGMSPSWPPGLASEVPRLDEVVVIATTTPASLAVLETQETLAVPRSGSSRLEQLLSQLHDGLARDFSFGPLEEGFLIQRCSFLLVPQRLALSGATYEIDENPGGQGAAQDPRAWLARGRELAGGAPAQAAEPSSPTLAVRIAELVVAKNRALFASDIRVDALVCTRSADPQGGVAAWTQKFHGIRDGERLTLDNGLIYFGPVTDFLDLTLLVSRDTKRSLQLAELLARRASDAGVRDAVSALQLGSAPWVTAVGGSVALAALAYEVLLGVAGTSIGLYRTSFLRRERYGLGRHPREGLYRAQDFAFALTIEQAEVEPTSLRPVGSPP